MVDPLDPAPPRLRPGDIPLRVPSVTDPNPGTYVPPKENGMKNLIFGASWRTSLWGYIVSAGTLVYQGIHSGLTLKDAAIAAAIAIAGRIAKDGKTTGIGAKATSNPALDGTRTT